MSEWTENRQVVSLLDQLAKHVTKDDIELLKKVFEEVKGSELEVLEDLMNYTYKTKPVSVRKFVEDPYYLNLAGQIYPKLLDDLEELFSGSYVEAIFTGGIGYGKCLTGDALILTDQGLIPIADIHERKNVQVFGVDGDYSLVKTTVRASKCSGVKPVYELTLKSGLHIRATAEHPILTGNGWKQLKDLSKEDLVATARRMPVEQIEDVDDNLIKFLAYMIGDGATGEYRVGKSPRLSLSNRFTNKDEAILEEFKSVCYNLGSPQVRVVQNRDGVQVLEPNGMRDILRKYGLAGKTAQTKRIPDVVWRSGLRGIALFLNRLFACDGSVFAGNPPHIEITMASEGLVDDIMLALRVLGVHARKWPKQVKLNGKVFNSCKVGVSGVTQIGKFFDTVGQILTKENGDLVKILQTKRSNPNVDVVPIGYEEMKEIRHLVGGMARNEWYRWRPPKGQRLGYEKYRRFVRNYEDRLPREFRRLASNDIFWDGIKSIEYVGEEKVYDLDVPETHNFIANGIIVHNSTFAEVAMCRMVYEISCLRNPTRIYGLMEGSPIVLINVSVSREKAIDVVFHGIKSRIQASPYFLEQCPPNANLRQRLVFPNNVWMLPVSSEETGVLGYNIFGGVMDEVNFWEIVERSKRAQGGKFDKAVTMYTSLIRRMKSRFMTQGKLPGILIQISSAKYPDDFTERRIKETRGDPTVLVRRYAQWETRPQEFYSSRKFYVLVGNKQERSRILKDPKEKEHYVKDGFEVVEVPEDYRSDFEKDIDAAIRDIAGRSTLTIQPYIVMRHKITDAINRSKDRGLVHPFTREETTLQDGAIFVPSKLLIPRLRKQWEFESNELRKKLIFEEYNSLQAKPRFVHIDLAVKNDCAGIAMGYVDKMISVIRRNADGQEFTTLAPVIVIEFVLRVRAPQHGEIILADVRSLVSELRSYGYHIGKVTFDSFESKDSMQQLKLQGFNVEYLSVDSDATPYNMLKDALYEDRLILYSYPPLEEELVQLERNNMTGKIDHPPNGSKDVSDAVAGVCFHCERESAIAPLPPPSLGILVDTREEKAIEGRDELYILEVDDISGSRRIIRRW